MFSSIPLIPCPLDLSINIPATDLSNSLYTLPLPLRLFPYKFSISNINSAVSFLYMSQVNDLSIPCNRLSALKTLLKSPLFLNLSFHSWQMTSPTIQRNKGFYTCKEREGLLNFLPHSLSESVSSNLRIPIKKRSF